MSNFDPVAFQKLEHVTWQVIATGYHRGYGLLTAQTAPALLAAANISAASTLLDIATGPGYIAATASELGAQVVGLDFSLAMVQMASQLHPRPNFLVGDAQALPFAPASFEAATINFGLGHFARPELALAEIYRVLKPGGRLAFTNWDSLDKTVGRKLIQDALQQTSTNAPPLPTAPPLGNAAAICQQLQGLGFANPQVTELPLVWHLASIADYISATLHGTVRTRVVLNAQPDLTALEQKLETSVAPYREADGLKLPMPALLFSAIKP